MNSLLNTAYFLSCFATIADSASLVRLSLATREIPLSFSKVVLKAREDQRVDRIRVWMNEVLKIIPLLEESNRHYEIMLNTNYIFFTCWKFKFNAVSLVWGKGLPYRLPNSDDTLYKPSEQEQLSHQRKIMCMINRTEAQRGYQRFFKMFLKRTKVTRRDLKGK